MSYESALLRLDDASSALAGAARMRLGVNVPPRGLAERADAALRAALRELPRADRKVAALIDQARMYLRPYAGMGFCCAGLGQAPLPGPLGPAFGVQRMSPGAFSVMTPQGMTLPGTTMATKTVGPQFSAARQLIAAARQLVAARVRHEVKALAEGVEVGLELAGMGTVGDGPPPCGFGPYPPCGKRHEVFVALDEQTGVRGRSKLPVIPVLGAVAVFAVLWAAWKRK